MKGAKNMKPIEKKTKNKPNPLHWKMNPVSNGRGARINLPMLDVKTLLEEDNIYKITNKFRVVWFIADKHSTFDLGLKFEEIENGGE